MALFGEKYGEIVRVVKAERYFNRASAAVRMLTTQAKIGLFRIISRSSGIAAGARRIEAVYGALT